MENWKLNALKSELFSSPSATVFVILDGATVPDLPASLAAFSPERVCLYRGDLEPDMAEVAPYLAILERDDVFTEWVLCSGWGRCWGIFGTSQARLPELRKHFRRFVKVHNEQTGKLLYFRFYDPTALRVYLPSCTSDELVGFFGPVDCYLMEDAEPGHLSRFLLAGNALRQERRSVQ